MAKSGQRNGGGSEGGEALLSGGLARGAREPGHRQGGVSDDNSHAPTARWCMAPYTVPDGLAPPQGDTGVGGGFPDAPQWVSIPRPPPSPPLLAAGLIPTSGGGEGGHAVEADRVATAAAIPGDEGGDGAAGAAQADGGLGRAGCRHQPVVEGEAAEGQDGMAAHGAAAGAVQEDGGQVGSGGGGPAPHHHRPVHPGMAPRLVHQRPPHVVLRRRHLPPQRQQRQPRRRRLLHRLQPRDDAQRLAARVHLHCPQHQARRRVRRQPPLPHPAATLRRRHCGPRGTSPPARGHAPEAEKSRPRVWPRPRAGKPRPLRESIPPWGGAWPRVGSGSGVSGSSWVEEESSLTGYRDVPLW